MRAEQLTDLMNTKRCLSVLGCLVFAATAFPFSLFSASGLSTNWVRKADLPRDVYLSGGRDFGVAVLNDKMYLVGGLNWPNAIATVEEYDPALDKWTKKADMLQTRYAPAAAVVNGKLYAMGGGESPTIATVEEYDPVLNQWTSVASMPQATYGAQAVTVNGKIYAIGGQTGNYAQLSTVQEYDPSANSWELKAPMPAARMCFGAVVINGHIYVVGGRNDLGADVLSAFEYDPVLDKWSSRAKKPNSLAAPGDNLAAVAVNGRVVTFGGGVVSALVQEYDPVSDVWTRLPDMPTNRQPGCYAALLNNTVYVFGSWDENSMDAVAVLPPVPCFSGISHLPDQTINEDTASPAIPFTVGDTETPPDRLAVSASSWDTSLIPDRNIVIEGAGTNRTVRITPAHDQFGKAMIMITVTDEAGCSTGETFEVTVNPVNDRPSFTKGPDLTVTNTAGPQTVAGWATAISAGPPDETGQTLSFVVTNDRDALFSVQPAISPTGTLTFTPTRDTNGTAIVTVVLKDSGGTAYGGVDTSVSQTFTITVTNRTDLPPTVQIVTPANFSIFCQATPVEVAATAAAKEGSIARLEIYVGPKLVATAASNSCSTSLTGLLVGDYALTARALDLRGLSSTSAVVNVAVVEPPTCPIGDSCLLEATIIASPTDPEVGWMRTNLFEAGLRSQVVDRQGFRYDSLTNSALVVWHGLSAGEVALTQGEVEVLRQASANGKRLYFIGDRLASAALNLGEPWRSQWQELLHLSTPTGTANDGSITFPNRNHLIINGRFGEVSESIAYTDAVEVATATSDAEPLGFCGGAQVLVAFDLVGEGAVKLRSVTQNFAVVGGADAAMGEERKKLFQNSVFWLLECIVCPSSGLAVSSEASTNRVSVCSPLAYTNIVQHNGECPGMGIIVTNWLPPGVTFESAEVTEGYYWREEDGRVIWYVGHLSSISDAQMRLTVIPYLPGLITNVVLVGGSGESFHNSDRADIVTEVVGQAVERPRITRQPEGQTVESGSSVTLSVEASGTPPFAYEWHRDGGALSNATSACLVITNAQSENQGTYTVVVWNCAGSVTSSNAAVTVYPPGLRFKSIVPLSDGSVQLTVVGKAGQRFVLQSSDDLATWPETLGTGGTNALGTAASVSLIDSNALHLPTRFYRAKLVQ